MIDPFVVYSKMLIANGEFAHDMWLGAMKSLDQLPSTKTIGSIDPGTAVCTRSLACRLH